MKTYDINKFVRETEYILSLKLKNFFPIIDKLDNLESLIDFRLNDITIDSIGKLKFLKVSYEGIASVKLYPHVRSNLIRYDVIKKHYFLKTTLKNKNQQNEYEEVIMGTNNRMIQVSLRAFNPEYKF